MKKTSILFVMLLLFSTAYAEEALMWTSQSDPVIASAEGFREASPIYEHPKQYLLQLRSLANTAALNDLLSETFGPVSVEQDNHEIKIISSHAYFRRSSPDICAVRFPGVDDVCLAGKEQVVQRLQDILKNIGWSDVCAPDTFCTARQVVQRGTNPIEVGKGYVADIPEEEWDDFYYLHFMQKIDGYPLEIWIEDANEDEYETRDATFVLDAEGRIVTGRIFPGYEVIDQSELSGKLLTAYEAGERCLKIMLSNYDWTKTWDGMSDYECAWEITGFAPSLVLTHDGVALPCWQIKYRMIITSRTTGERYSNDRTYSINALTGAD